MPDVWLEKRWKVVGNTLMEYDVGTTYPPAIVEFYERFSGHSVEKDQSEFEIVSVGSDEIVLRHRGTELISDITLRRVKQ